MKKLFAISLCLFFSEIKSADFKESLDLKAKAETEASQYKDFKKLFFSIIYGVNNRKTNGICDSGYFDKIFDDWIVAALSTTSYEDLHNNFNEHLDSFTKDEEFIKYQKQCKPEFLVTREILTALSNHYFSRLELKHKHVKKSN